MSAATSVNSTLYFDFIEGKAERIFPCRCGETHRGPYGIYDYGHHNCFHDSPLVRVAPDEEPDYLMCPDCGKSFRAEAS